MAHLIEDRWLRIPEEAIYRQFVHLNRRDWGIQTIDVVGENRHYLSSSSRHYVYPYSLPVEVIEYLANRLNKGIDMTWYKKYNEQAMVYFEEHGVALNQALKYWEEVGNPDLPRPTIKPVDTLEPPLVYGLEDGDEYIAIIGLFHLTGGENWGNHHLYIDLIDENGERIYTHDPPLYLYYGWEGMTREQERTTDPIRIDKPKFEPGANIGLKWEQILNGFHINNIPCDRFNGIHIRYGDLEPDGKPDPGNRRGHHSHYMVLQKRIFRTTPLPSEPFPTPPSDSNPKPIPPPPEEPVLPIQIVNIQVKVNVAWINTLPQDEQGNVTFSMKLNE